MSTEYTKTTWQTGDIITADKMNNIENGIKGIEGDITTLSGMGSEIDELGEELTDIKDGLNTVKNDLNTDIAKNAIWEDKKQITVNTGVIADSAVYSTAIVTIPIDAGEITVTTYASSPVASIAFYDANNVYISNYFNVDSTNRLHTLTVEIPEGASKVGFSCFTNQLNIFNATYEIIASDKLINSKVDSALDVNIGNMVFYEFNGNRLNSNGSVTPYNGYVTSSKIPAKSGQFLTFNYASQGIIICAYDASDTLLVYTIPKKSYILPVNTAYIRICTTGTTLKTYNFKLIDLDIPTPYSDIPVLEGVRINTTNGAYLFDIYNAFSSYYIDVSNTPVLEIFHTESVNCLAFFYDSDFSYISAQTIYPMPQTNIVNAPANAKYMALTSSNGFTTWTITPQYRDVYIGTGRKYTSILHALKNERGAVRFIVEKGTYNVVSEYEAEYGSAFWSEYTGYVGTTDLSLRGYSPYVGQQMIFRQGAKVVFDYSGDNTKVFEEFSVFNLTMDNILDGADITFGTRICRYAIHDDLAVMSGRNIIKNCIFRGQSYNGPVIGGGCGNSNEYIIEHCLFENNGGYADIMYHNSLNADAVNRVHVRDCIGEKGVTFYYCGSSTIVSDFVVSNSKFPNIVVSPHPSVAHENENVRLVEYCNDKTPVT